MWQLTAQGARSGQRWRENLDPGRTYVIGRSLQADLPVPWERHLSGLHLELTAHDDRVAVRNLAADRNPVFRDGEEVSEFEASGPTRFVIGQTSFLLNVAEMESAVTPQTPLKELTFTADILRGVRFEDADRRIDVLAQLPDVIGGAGSFTELANRLIQLLMAGIRRAEAVAVVERTSKGAIRVVQWERRIETAGTFRPSSKLVAEALHRGSSVLHVWRGEPASPEYTASSEFDWAYCTPVGRERGRRWGVYVAGRILDPEAGGWGPHDLQADVKFTDFVAAVIQSVERLNRMEGTLSVLRQFLSPPILAALENTGAEGELNTSLLEPRECDVTVLFCDLRGFSQHVEEATDDLRSLLRRVSAALQIMTGAVLEHGGVTGDFMGDAVLGFWGWPFASESSTVQAARAALAIRSAFAEAAKDPEHVLADFRVGVGIAHGRAVAGRIGTEDRVTVTVFGPVVNLASRLESMTKQLRVPILLDETSARQLQNAQSWRTDMRLRQLGRVQPYGIERPLLVSELLPSLSGSCELTDEHLARYELGVQQFIDGDWEAAYQTLHALPSSDRAQDFLLAIITQHNRTAPDDWDGVVRLPNK